MGDGADLTTEVPIIDPGRQLFVERVGVEARVRRRLLDVGRAALSGPPRVGKTTICLRLMRWWTEELGGQDRHGPARRAVKIGLERDGVDWKAFGTALALKLREGLDLAPRRRSTDRGAAKADLIDLVRAGGPLLVVIDELNELAPDARHAPEQRELRRRAACELVTMLADAQTEVTTCQLAVLLSGSVEPRDVLGVAGDSLAAIEVEPIHDFDPSEFEEFLRALGTTPRAREWLASLGAELGGHPQLLQEALVRLRRGELGDAPSVDVGTATEEYSKRLRGEGKDTASAVLAVGLDSIRSFLPAERLDLLALYGKALAEDRAVTDDLWRARRLRNAGLVSLRVRGDQSVEVQPRSPLFRTAFDLGWVASRANELRRPFANDALEWDRRGRRDAMLPTRLEAAVAALESSESSLSDVERDLLSAASGRLLGSQRSRHKWPRALVGVLATLLVFASIVGANAARQAAATQRELAELRLTMLDANEGRRLEGAAESVRASAVLQRVSRADRERVEALLAAARAAAASLGERTRALRERESELRRSVRTRADAEALAQRLADERSALATALGEPTDILAATRALVSSMSEVERELRDGFPSQPPDSTLAQRARAARRATQAAQDEARSLAQEIEQARTQLVEERRQHGENRGLLARAQQDLAAERRGDRGTVLHQEREAHAQTRRELAAERVAAPGTAHAQTREELQNQIQDLNRDLARVQAQVRAHAGCSDSIRSLRIAEDALSACLSGPSQACTSEEAGLIAASHAAVQTCS